MTTAADADLVALDRFVSSIYWADHDITLAEAFVAAFDDWLAAAAAEHNDSKSFTTGGGGDPLGASLMDLVAAVAHLAKRARPELTVARAFSEAIIEWARSD